MREIEAAQITEVVERLCVGQRDLGRIVTQSEES